MPVRPSADRSVDSSPATVDLHLVDLDSRAAGARAVKAERVSRLRYTPLVAAVVDLVALMLPAVDRSSGRLAVAGFAVATIALLHAKGMYARRLRLSVLDYTPELLKAAVVAGLGIGIAVQLWDLKPGLSAAVVMMIVGLCLQFAFRALLYAGVFWLRRRGHLIQRCAVIGSGKVAAQIMQTLNVDSRYGLKLVGFIDKDHASDQVNVAAPLGDVTRLNQIVADNNIDVLIVAFGWGADHELAHFTRMNDHAGPTVFVVPRLFEIYAGRGHSEHIGAIPVDRVDYGNRPTVSMTVKRALDIFVSLSALLVLSPVLLAAAIAVRLEGGKGVLFRQQRVGRGGRTFELYKFRSMRPANENEQQTTWNIADDDRVGPVGKVLRKTSIDELPQLWNIVRGQMSLVGPRPERPHFVDTFSSAYPEYDYRHRVRVGLTGLAQVNGLRGDTSISDRARYDNYYIDNWSLWLDIKIMLSTLREVVGARGR